MNWSAHEEDEGVFYAVSETERLGPYPNFDEAQRAAYEEELSEIQAELGTGFDKLAEVLTKHGILDEEDFQEFFAEKVEEASGVIVR